MLKFSEPLVWVIVALGQYYVGTKLIMYPESANLYDYLIVALVSLPLIVSFIYKKVKQYNNI